MSPSLAVLAESKLRQALRPIVLEIQDESARHAGHSGARNGGGHLRVFVVSEAFEGLDLLARHRLVYDALSEELGGLVHALAVRAETPDEHNG